MQEAVDRYEKRRLLPREVAGIKSVALRESIEWRYQVCYLFKALGKQEKYKKLQGVCDDASWLMQQFAEMLHVPRYALIKRCPLGDNEDFPFHPLIYEEKMYSRYDSDIRVTNCNDDSLITTLTGHTDYVSCLIIDDGKLYSGSDDGTIKIWNCSTNKLIKTLAEGHTDSVLCFTIDDGKLYSGGSYLDKTIKIWDCSDDSLITTLTGHTGNVKCLTIHDGKLYSGGGLFDHTIKVWDCSTYELIATLGFNPTPDFVRELTFQNGKLYSKDDSGTIKIWKL